MINRILDINELKRRVKLFPVTAILGPRQCGKTTLAKQIEHDYYFDLENPRDASQFENPQLTLERCKGLIVIDEIQRKADLFPILRHMFDTRKNQRYMYAFLR